MKNYVGADYILCRCGNSFCWKCGKQAHRPASCNDGEKWQLKNSAESENITWIMANTKNCPKCQKPIEKNQGCNHMTCRVCNHDFCWMCLGAWAEHGQKTGGYYNCNKYEELKKKGDTSIIKEENSRQNHQNQLRKYMFYFERFNNHERSEKHAKELLPSIKSKIELLHQIKHYPLSELEFLVESLNEVVQCRQVLKWSYAFGYFMNEAEDKNLF